MVIFIFASATVSVASEDQAAPVVVKDLKLPSGLSEECVITGMIQKYEPQKKIKPQAYQIVNEKQEHFKIIGPKSITEQIISTPEFEKRTFRFVGKIIKKEDKKGILISKFEVCQPQAPQTPAPATLEVETKK